MCRKKERNVQTGMWKETGKHPSKKKMFQSEKMNNSLSPLFLLAVHKHKFMFTTNTLKKMFFHGRRINEKE
jgi:hypothetical protein